MSAAMPDVDGMDPLKALLQFHRSIRAALDTFDALAVEARMGRVDPLKASALYDFFIGPMRWHDLDEQESLLMRLARKEPEQFHAAVRASIAEHDAVDAAVREVLEHLHALAQHSQPPNAPLLTDHAQRLRALMEPHLAREERDVFPRAKDVLGADDIEQMKQEMAARRLRRLVDGPGARAPA